MNKEDYKCTGCNEFPSHPMGIHEVCQCRLLEYSKTYFVYGRIYKKYLYIYYYEKFILEIREISNGYRTIYTQNIKLETFSEIKDFAIKFEENSIFL